MVEHGVRAGYMILKCSISIYLHEYRIQLFERVSFWFFLFVRYVVLYDVYMGIFIGVLLNYIFTTMSAVYCV